MKIVDLLNESVTDKNVLVIDDSWGYHQNSQLGSNPGGLFDNQKTGKKVYFKTYKNHKQIAAEYASAKIHELMGVKILPITIAKITNSSFLGEHSDVHPGNFGIASEWNPNLQVLSHNFYQIDEDDANHLGKSYIAAILCENWDVIGLAVDNQLRDVATKELISVDHGGSFHFRAMGGDKDYNHGDIATKETLRQYGAAADVFNFVFEKFPKAETSGLQHLMRIRHGDVQKIFNDAGYPNAAEMTNIVMSRAALLLEHYSSGDKHEN